MNETSLLRAANVTYDYQTRELNVSYVACEIVVAILAVAGNALVIYVFLKDRRLRRRTNYYIVSLAAADFLVGFLGIPFAIMSSVGLPNNLHACLFTVSLLVVLCTISIFCLVAVSVDRYWAILHPMGYSRNVRTKTALVIISICWFAGCLIGLLPLLGWHQGKASNVDCFFLSVMDYNYLVFLYFGTIITPALILAAFYAHIYRVILQQLRQIVVMNPDKAGGKKCKNLPSSGMIRMLGAQQRNDVKVTQNLAIIVLFFMICWIPLYTINCIIAFRKDFPVNSTFMLSCIILSHLNSAGNPLLYAYHLKDFRAALKSFFCDLLGIQQTSPQMPPRQFSNFSTYHRSKYNSNFSSPHRIMSPGCCRNVEAIVKNPIIVATAPAAGLNKNIWNIAEDSGRDSGGSSQDSFKDSSHHDTLLMPRPATPFKPKILKAYAEPSSIGDPDGAFHADCLPNDTKDTEKSLSVNHHQKVLHSSTGEINQHFTKNVTEEKSCSKSSPQLSKAVFVIEPTDTGESIAEKINLSQFRNGPYRLTSNLLTRNRTLNRSLSDSGSMKKFNGIMPDYYSVPM